MKTEGQDTFWGRVAVGVRMTCPQPEFVDSYANLCANGLRPGDQILRPAIRMPHHMAAEVLARDFLKSDCTSLLMLDDDMVFPADALEKLRTAPAAGFSVLSALCCCGRFPYRPIVMAEHGERTFRVLEPSSGVVEVAMTGLAFTLIHVAALRTDAGWNFAWAEDGGGEDGEFCRRVRAAGLRVGVFQDLPIGHVSKVTVRWDPEHKRSTLSTGQDDRLRQLVESVVAREEVKA